MRSPQVCVQCVFRIERRERRSSTPSTIGRRKTRLINGRNRRAIKERHEISLLNSPLLFSIDIPVAVRGKLISTFPVESATNYRWLQRGRRRRRRREINPWDSYDSCFSVIGRHACHGPGRSGRYLIR